MAQQDIRKFIRKTLNESGKSGLLDVIAAQEHDQWAHWMKYMFSCGKFNDDGSWTMPPDKVERWKRQCDTSYTSLSGKEQESDKEMAEKPINAIKSKMLEIVKSFGASQELIQKIIEL